MRAGFHRPCPDPVPIPAGQAVTRPFLTEAGRDGSARSARGPRTIRRLRVRRAPGRPRTAHRPAGLRISDLGPDRHNLRPGLGGAPDQLGSGPDQADPAEDRLHAGLRHDGPAVCHVSPAVHGGCGADPGDLWPGDPGGGFGALVHRRGGDPEAGRGALVHHPGRQRPGGALEHAATDRDHRRPVCRADGPELLLRHRPAALRHHDRAFSRRLARRLDREERPGRPDGHGRPQLHGGRRPGGALMAMGALSCMAAAVLAAPRRTFWLLMFAGCTALLLLSRSKTSLASLIIGLAAIAFVGLVRRGPVMAVVGTWLGVAGAAVLGGIMALAPELIFGVLNKDATLTGRTEIWSAAMHQGMLNNPVLGFGYGVLWDHRDPYDPALWIAHDAGFVAGHAHNGWLEVWLGLGFVGLALWALAYLGNLIRMAGAIYTTSMAYAALPFFLVFSVFSITEVSVIDYHDISWTIYVAFAAMLSSRHPAEEAAS
ncbi:MAG: O-antigen ligase family protein [Caulobacteraceae bacterium]|nr:O-antigen ligase family protein [Caulobacteraceae bacterium]